jgi:hypothetical protein
VATGQTGHAGQAATCLTTVKPFVEQTDKEYIVTRTIVIKNALVAVVATALVCGTATFAQAPVGQPPAATAKPPAPEKPLVPLKVLVTLSRFDGEKKTGSLPFTLWVNANDHQGTTFNIGMSVPVQQQSGNTPATFTYRNVGTNLRCSAVTVDDGRFRVDLNIDDSSVAANKDGAGGLPTFQSITTQNSLLLRDGQTAQFLAATDKVTGEVTKVEVTISVLK